MNIKTRKAKIAALIKASQDTSENRISTKEDTNKADDVNLADIKDPQEYAHRVFEMLVNRLDIEGSGK